MNESINNDYVDQLALAWDSCPLNFPCFSTMRFKLQILEGMQASWSQHWIEWNRAQLNHNNRSVSLLFTFLLVSPRKKHHASTVSASRNLNQWFNIIILDGRKTLYNSIIQSVINSFISIIQSIFNVLKPNSKHS